MSDIKQTVLDKMADKYDAGVAEHGGEMDQGGVSSLEWLLSLQEELMDAVFYIEAIVSNEEGEDL